MPPGNPVSSKPAPPNVSARWLLAAAALMLAAAAACGWGAFCYVFWQGGWQLLYHPAGSVTRTPAGAGLAFDPVGFASTEAGEPRLRGWWIPAAPDGRFRRYTVLCLHGQDGNLGDTVDALASLHSLGVNLLAFDYRGYGQSQFARPSEADWRQDAAWALGYLTGTRRIEPGTIILDGSGLGANLALEIAAEHPELAGVILRDPLARPVDAIFLDPRARLVPARLLVRDRFDSDEPASALRIPSLWLLRIASPPNIDMVHELWVYNKVSAPKKLLWLPAQRLTPREESDAFSGLLGDPHPPAR